MAIVLTDEEYEQVVTSLKKMRSAVTAEEVSEGLILEIKTISMLDSIDIDSRRVSDDLIVN
jgi:hypothetical protein